MALNVETGSIKRIGGMNMSTYLRLSIKRQKEDGTIVNGTRVHKGAGGFNDDFTQAADIKTYLEKLQPVITDTITGAELIVETTLPDGVVPTGVAAGSVNAAWADMDNVKLTNSYTNGNIDAKETIARPATAATEQQLRVYAGATATWSAMGDTTAIQGYYSGTSVESAWTAD